MNEISAASGMSKASEASLTIGDSEAPISISIVERVAARENVDPLQIEPLYKVIDPDALDAIVNSASASSAEPLEVEFEYAGYDVVVASTGEIDITPAT